MSERDALKWLQVGAGFLNDEDAEMCQLAADELAALRARVAELEAWKGGGVWLFDDGSSFRLVGIAGGAHVDGIYAEVQCEELSVDGRLTIHYYKRTGIAVIERTDSSAPTAYPDPRLAHGTGPDVLERIAETTQTRLTDQERGHLMDAATLIRTLQKRNEDLANEFLRTGPRQGTGDV
jgi:hypothetical protein